MTGIPIWVVDWSNGHASGTFGTQFGTRKWAEHFARQWKSDMVAMETTPAGRREARAAYQWEVRTTNSASADAGDTEAAFLSDDSPRDQAKKETRR